MAKKKPEFTVIRDTNEKAGFKWDFPAKDGCLGSVDRHLKTGDYSLEGYEDIFVIERKHNTAEIADNFFDPRFERELVRLEAFQYPFVVCEFSFDRVVGFPNSSGVPQHLWPRLKVTAKSMMMRLNQIQIKYPSVRFIFAGSPYNARCFSFSLFKRIVEHVPRPEKSPE